MKGCGIYSMYDYDLAYGNLDLNALTDDELLDFAHRCIGTFFESLYLIRFSDSSKLSYREADITQEELSELSLIMAALELGYSKTTRRRYQDTVDQLLFNISLYAGNPTSIKGHLRNGVARVMRNMRETLVKEKRV